MQWAMLHLCNGGLMIYEIGVAPSMVIDLFLMCHVS